MKFGQEDLSLIYSTYEKKDKEEDIKITQINNSRKNNIIRKATVVDSGIDLKLLTSSRSKKISKSDLLFTIIEIGNNSIKYDLFYLPKSRLFWHLAIKNKCVRRILRDYTSNQLKHIWSLIYQIPQKQLIAFIIKNRDLINMSYLK